VPADIAIIVSTYERPQHLARCLESIAVQQGVDGRFEVVVTDDGSRDETLGLVAAAARRSDFPLTFTTHDHAGFQLARCRNEGTAASTAPYLLFTDGDCLLPRDHVWIHLDERRRGWITGGDCGDARQNREQDRGVEHGRPQTDLQETGDDQQHGGQEHRGHDEPDAGRSGEPSSVGHLRPEHHEHEERTQHEARTDRQDARREYEVRVIFGHSANSEQLSGAPRQTLRMMGGVWNSTGLQEFRAAPGCSS